MFEGNVQLQTVMDEGFLAELTKVEDELWLLMREYSRWYGVECGKLKHCANIVATTKGLVVERLDKDGSSN